MILSRDQCTSTSGRVLWKNAFVYRSSSEHTSQYRLQPTPVGIDTIRVPCLDRRLDAGEFRIGELKVFRRQ